jgi:two-component system chemotaxis sensor kinase CheA
MEINRRAKDRLRARLLVGCMTPLIIAVVCQAFYTVLAQRQAMLGGLEEKARSLGELMVDVVGPSLALDDPHGVQEGLGYIQKDADFSFAATLTSDGTIAGYQGPEDSRAALLATVSLVNSPRSVTTHDVLVSLYPLTPGTTQLGTVAIGLKTANVRAAVTRMVLRVVLIASAGILVALVVVLLLASAIVRRNQDLKLIMDNVGQGFLTVQQDGELLPEHSAILEAWFGPWTAGQPFWAYLGARAPEIKEGFESLWSNVIADILPVDVSLGQLPNRIVVAAKIFDIAYHPISKGDQLAQVLMVISDVTVQVEQERATVEQRELVVLFQWLIKDRHGLLEFRSDASGLVDSVLQKGAAEDRVTLKRNLHTLKGNCSVFNLTSVVTVCQDIEGRLEDGDDPTEGDRARLEAAWTSVEKRLHQLGAREENGRLEIEEAEYQAILTAIGQGFPHSDLHEMARRWTLDPLKQRLSRLAEQAAALAVRLKRGNIGVRVNASGIRLPGTALAAFWNAAGHLIRNAIDHGLECPNERIECGKKAVGLIELRANIHGDRLFVEIEDDGRGIAWDKLAEQARRIGLPAESRDDLIAALFSDGVTTTDSVTEVSGRGVGMSVVRAACLETGGTIRVWSKLGIGTRFEFSWPTVALLGQASAALPPAHDDAPDISRPALEGPWSADRSTSGPPASKPLRVTQPVLPAAGQSS